MINKIKCLLGFHQIIKEREVGFFRIGICKNCYKKLRKDCHWIMGDNKWIEAEDELERYFDEY